MPLSAPEALTGRHDISQFASGKPALDNWLRQRALANQQKGFSAVVVVCDGERVAGYYALAPAAVSPTAFARAVRTGQPPDPIPCILLGQLAVDLAYAGGGVGTGLLKHAYARILKAAELVGGRALLVNAVDDDALAFWERREFVQTKDDRYVLYRAIASIARSLGAGP
ncbi:MAG: GNAT family N-acetyltransferase [Rhizomicrobium sp.]